MTIPSNPFEPRVWSTAVLREYLTDKWYIILLADGTWRLRTMHNLTVLYPSKPISDRWHLMDLKRGS